MMTDDIKVKIIQSIKSQFGTRFRVFDNTTGEKKVIAGQFPDVIFMQNEPPPNNNILIVMKIETTGNFLESTAEWQALASSPTVLYLVVPKEKLDEAKLLAARIGVRTRFGSYELEGGNIKSISYE